MNKKALFIIGSAFFLLSAGLGVHKASAGFGITPPYVQNDSLTRGSSYTQKIVLSRSDALDDLNVQVTIAVPGANDWITIDKGTSFVMHKDEQRVAMNVNVAVPGGAKFGNYSGNIRVVITPLTGPTPGTVGIALGAQIDVNLNVIDKKIYSFNVRNKHIDPVEEGHKVWGFFFPGKISFTMQVENTGNVPFGPTKVVFDISDTSGGTILETTQNLNSIEQIQPFQIKNVVAELPTRLKAGAYKAIFKIYNNDTIVDTGELDMGILPYGAIPGYQGFGFIGLQRSEQMIIVGGAALILLALYLIGRRVYVWVKRRRA
jgi:hypothetical protein